MKRLLVPILLLATVALSTSNVIPLLSTDNVNGEPLSFDSQTNDNTFRNRFDNRNVFNIFCKDTVFRKSDPPTPCRSFRLNNYIRDMNKVPINDDNAINKDDNHNGEGYRKKQWHNYPRQLDRLQNQPYDRHKVNYMIKDSEPDEAEYKNALFKKSEDVNEYLLASNDAPNNIYDSYVTSSSPLLILRIRLACLNDKLANISFTETPEYRSGFEARKQDVDGEDDINPSFNPDVKIMKLKRGGPAYTGDEYLEIDTPTVTIERLPVKKRIFSLWSRLQTLAPTGHQLHHRRHLHAFYALPEDFGGDGTLTAETRAALMRPPGSPLRWG